MRWSRVVSAIVLGAAIFALVAWFVPGLSVAVGIAIGAGTGAAVGLNDGRRARRTSHDH